MSMRPWQRSRQSSPGFTLVELLVVMAVIGLLMAILLPAIQHARESARARSCANNLKQITLAVANFEVQNGHYPASCKFTPPEANGDISGWSAQAILLPHLEQANVFAEIDFDQSYKLSGAVATADGVSTKVSAIRVPTYLCPSEPRDEARLKNGAPEHYPLNYAVNLGVWFVYDPKTGEGGEGVFYPGSHVRTAEVEDGMSNTMCASEVKAWNPYYRNAAYAEDLGIPTPADLCSLGGDFKATSGHTEWVDGRAHQIGFTTAFRPNESALCTVSGSTYDVDWTNQQEGKSDIVATYAAVTARSHHAGGVNVSLLDGSVRWVADDVNLGVWRAMSTRRGGEIMPADVKTP